MPNKKVNNEAIYFNLDPINVLNSKKLLNFNFNFDPINDLIKKSKFPFISNKCSHKCCKSRILEDLPKNVIIGLKIAL